MSPSVIAAVACAGLVTGALLGVVALPDESIATDTALPATSSTATSALASTTTSTSRAEAEERAIATTEGASSEPVESPVETTTTTTTTQPPEPSSDCNRVAEDRTGLALTSLRRLESVSFIVEVCETVDGALWYHGVRIFGDPITDSITLPAVEIGPGTYRADNSGWVYLASPDRITLTSPAGVVALDHPLHDAPSTDRVSGERSGTLLVDVANLRSRPSLDAPQVRQVTGQEGAAITVHGRQAAGWLEVTIDGTRGWVFGAFVTPPDSNLAVARTVDEELPVLRDREGRLLTTENASGSYVLIIERGSTTHHLILPDGSSAFVAASDVRILAG